MEGGHNGPGLLVVAAWSVVGDSNVVLWGHCMDDINVGVSLETGSHSMCSVGGHHGLGGSVVEPGC